MTETDASKILQAEIGWALDIYAKSMGYIKGPVPEDFPTSESMIGYRPQFLSIGDSVTRQPEKPIEPLPNPPRQDG